MKKAFVLIVTILFLLPYVVSANPCSPVFKSGVDWIEGNPLYWVWYKNGTLVSSYDRLEIYTREWYAVDLELGAKVEKAFPLSFDVFNIDTNEPLEGVPYTIFRSVDDVFCFLNPSNNTVFPQGDNIVLMIGSQKTTNPYYVPKWFYFRLEPNEKVYFLQNTSSFEEIKADNGTFFYKINTDKAITTEFSVQKISNIWNLGEFSVYVQTFQKIEYEPDPYTLMLFTLYIGLWIEIWFIGLIFLLFIIKRYIWPKPEEKNET